MASVRGMGVAVITKMCGATLASSTALPLRHAKTVLLIDDGQAQFGKHNRGLDECVGAHQNVNVAGLQIGQNGLAGGAFDRSCQEFHAHVHGAEHLPQPLEVLLGKDFRRGHDRRLVAVVFGKERRQQGPTVLPLPTSPCKSRFMCQPVLRSPRISREHALLGIGQLEGQPVVVKRVEGVSYFRKAHTRHVLGDRLLC